MQSKRTEIYRKKAFELLENGHAYRCFCSKTRLELMRREALKNRESPRYDGRCLSLSPSEIQERLSSKLPYVLRFKLTPGELAFKDLIYGDNSIDVAKIESDPIILKADGYPTYHLANVIDDHLMKISHVLRGVEWLGSTPKHIMLYRAFGWTPSHFAHLPLIYNSDGTKLSKRSNDIRVESLRAKGFMPESVLGYLTRMVRLDENESSKPLWTVEDMVEQFEIKQLMATKNFFSQDKMKEVNHKYLNHFLEHDRQRMAKNLRQLIEDTVGRDKSQDIKDDYIDFILNWSRVSIF